MQPACIAHTHTHSHLLCACVPSMNLSIHPASSHAHMPRSPHAGLCPPIPPCSAFALTHTSAPPPSSAFALTHTLPPHPLALPLP